MPTLKERLTPDYVEDLAVKLGEIWQSAHANWRLIDSYYQRTFDVFDKGVPGATGRSVYRPSTPTSVLNHAVDNQLALNPRFHREPEDDSSEEQARADRVEKALAKVVNDAASKETFIPWKLLGRYMFGYGYGQIEGPYWSPRGRPRKPKSREGEDTELFEARMARWRNQKEGWNPIKIRIPHPTTILVDPVEAHPRVAIKTVDMYAEDLRERSAERAGKLENARAFDQEETIGPFDKIKLLEGWTEAYHTVKVSAGQGLTLGNEDAYWVERNPRLFVPVVHGFAGFGMPPGNDPLNPLYMAQGILGPILDSLKVQAQSESAKHQLLMAAAYLPWMTELDPAEIANAIAQGQMVQVPGKESIWPMPGREVTSWMFRIGEEVGVDIEAGTYSRALAGMREPGVSTVGQTAILTTIAQRIGAALLKQMETMVKIMCQRVLQMVDMKGQAIGVDGVVLTPEDINHNYNIDVTFEAIDPVLQLQQREVGLREVIAGVISPRTHRELNIRMEDETTEADRLLEHELEQIPEVKSALLRSKAKELGIEQAFDDALKRAGGDIGLVEALGGNGAQPAVGSAERDLRQALTPDTPKPTPIERGDVPQ